MRPLPCFPHPPLCAANPLRIGYPQNKPEYDSSASETCWRRQIQPGHFPNQGVKRGLMWRFQGADGTATHLLAALTDAPLRVASETCTQEGLAHRAAIWAAPLEAEASPATPLHTGVGAHGRPAQWRRLRRSGRAGRRGWRAAHRNRCRQRLHVYWHPCEWPTTPSLP